MGKSDDWFNTKARPDEAEDDPDTMIVAPPNFRERLLAAQQAHAAEVRRSTWLPTPPRKIDALKALAADPHKTQPRSQKQ